jgi:hypothetical protein
MLSLTDRRHHPPERPNCQLSVRICVSTEPCAYVWSAYVQVNGSPNPQTRKDLSGTSSDREFPFLTGPGDCSTSSYRHQGCCASLTRRPPAALDTGKPTQRPAGTEERGNEEGRARLIPRICLTGRKGVRSNVLRPGARAVLAHAPIHPLVSKSMPADAPHHPRHQGVLVRLVPGSANDACSGWSVRFGSW